MYLGVIETSRQAPDCNMIIVHDDDLQFIDDVVSLFIEQVMGAMDDRGML